ncbi:MAG: hypothetical protein H7A39_01305 [Chlamydiales bacterium]|nr:hypothetical protein [Chlamydiales bacterium]
MSQEKNDISSLVSKIKIQARSGVITRREILQLNSNDYHISKLIRENFLKPLVPGIYLLADFPYPDYLDYILVSLKLEDPIICMISALNYHHMTLEFERCIHVAIPPRGKKVHIAFPPVCYYEYPEKTLEVGVEIINEPGWNIKVFNREKTLIDCLIFEEIYLEETIFEAFDSYLHYPKKNDPIRLFKYAEQFGVADKLNERLLSFASHQEIQIFYSQLKQK